MDCAEARDHLNDLNRGRLATGTTEAMRAHVRTCGGCAEALRIDAEMRALIRAEVPRHPAPAPLRTRVQALLAGSLPGVPAPVRPAGWRAWAGGHRWVVRSLAGAMAAVLLVWAGKLWMAGDPVARLADRALAEHKEYVEETMTSPGADPEALVRELQGEVRFSFGPVFPGDSQDHLVAGRVSDLSGRRAATFIYRDGVGRYTTLFLMPETGMVIPSQDHLPIETFKPYHRVVSGRQLLLWKQADLAYLLISDRDQAGSASLFLKIRKLK